MRIKGYECRTGGDQARAQDRTCLVASGVALHRSSNPHIVRRFGNCVGIMDKRSMVNMLQPRKQSQNVDFAKDGHVSPPQVDSFLSRPEETWDLELCLRTLESVFNP